MFFRVEVYEWWLLLLWDTYHILNSHYSWPYENLLLHHSFSSLEPVKTALFYLQSRQGVAQEQLKQHVPLLLSFSWVSTHYHSQSWQTEPLQEISFSWILCTCNVDIWFQSLCHSLFLSLWKACGTNFSPLLPVCCSSTKHLVVIGEKNKQRECFFWCLYSKRGVKSERGKESNGSV